MTSESPVQVSPAEGLNDFYSHFGHGLFQEGVWSTEDELFDRESELLEHFIPFFQGPHFEALVDKVLDKKQDRIIFFGDIYVHDVWKRYEILFMSTPVCLNEGNVEKFQASIVGKIADEMEKGDFLGKDPQMDPYKAALKDWLFENKERFMAVLTRLVHRNMTRNLQALEGIEFIDAIQLTREAVVNTVGRLSKQYRKDFLRDPQYVDASRSYRGDNLIELVEGIERDARATAWRTIMEAQQNIPKFSFKDILKILGEVKAEHRDRRDRAVAFMKHMVAIPGVSDTDLLEVEGRSLGNAEKMLNQLSEDLADTVTMLRTLCPEISLPERMNGNGSKVLSPPSLDLLTELAHMHAFELIDELARLRAIKKPSTEQTRRANEIQLYLLFSKNANWGFVDPAYHDAKGLDRRHGDKINEAIKPIDEDWRILYQDGAGNVFLDPNELPSFLIENVILTPDPKYMRQYLVKVDDIPALAQVYLPSTTSNLKTRGSAGQKSLRQNGDKLRELYDLHRNLVVHNMTAEEMASPEGRQIVEAIVQRRMEALGITERVSEDTPRSQIKAGQYKIDFSKLEANPDNPESNGLLVVKVYYRAHGEKGNIYGVGGEEQHMPIDTWANYKSPDHILHERFYKVQKLISIIRHYFSETVFPEYFEYIKYFESCMKALKQRAADNNGWVYGPRVTHPVAPLDPLDEASTQTMLPVIGPDIEDEVTAPSVVPLD